MPANSKDIDVFHIVQDKLNNNFDEIFNCDVENRFSDLGFIDRDRLMIRPRAWVEKVSNVPSDTGDNWWFFWYTDNDGNRSWYISKWWEVYTFDYEPRWNYVWYFCSSKEREESYVPWVENEYFIVNETLYQYSWWSINTLPKKYIWCFNNEADLWNSNSAPIDWLFAYLKDTDSVYISEDWEWIPFEENYDMTPIGLWNSWDYPACFNTVTLPKDFQISSSTATTATDVEKVPAPLAFASYVWSYIFITSGTYKWKFWYINNYDTTTNEFLIVSLWNATPIEAGTTYNIYETKGRYLQITNWVDPDKYWDGTQFISDFEWYVQQHLDKFTTMPNWWPWCILTYGNQSYTAINDIVYVSDVAQPLWFNINDVIDLQQSSPVTSLYIWKNRVVAWWDNFSVFIQADPLTWVNRTIDFGNSFGIVEWSMSPVLNDFWFLSTSWQILSLWENYAWWITVKNDIGIPVSNYLKTFRHNVSSGFDGRKYYIYWETFNETWYTCVYDTLYNFWSVYTGIRPWEFFYSNGIMYFTDNVTGDMYRFTTGKVTDWRNPIDQFISSRDTDLWNVFLQKQLANIFTYFENLDQEIELKVSCQTDNDSFCKRYTWKIFNKSPSKNPLSKDWCKLCTKNALGNNTLWYNNVCAEELVPHFKRFAFSNDKANSWKWQIRNISTNGFYLDQVLVQYRVSDDNIIHVEF